MPREGELGSPTEHDHSATPPSASCFRKTCFRDVYIRIQGPVCHAEDQVYE